MICSSSGWEMCSDSAVLSSSIVKLMAVIGAAKIFTVVCMSTVADVLTTVIDISWVVHCIYETFYVMSAGVTFMGEAAATNLNLASTSMGTSLLISVSAMLFSGQIA